MGFVGNDKFPMEKVVGIRHVVSLQQRMSTSMQETIAAMLEPFLLLGVVFDHDDQGTIPRPWSNYTLIFGLEFVMNL